MFTVYILHSEKYNKIYIGFTSNLEARINAHNSVNNKGFTKRYMPWAIIYTEEFEAKEEALKREKQLKSAKGRLFAWDIVNKTKNP